MGKITKRTESMFEEIRRLVSLENVVIEGIDHIPAKNRMMKGDRKLQLTFEAVLTRELHKIVDNPSMSAFFVHTKGNGGTGTEMNPESWTQLKGSFQNPSRWILIEFSEEGRNGFYLGKE